MAARRRLLRFLLAVHRLCLHAYPSWFRATHGEAMIATFEDLVTGSYQRAGAVGMTRRAMAEFGSLMFRGARERFSRRPLPPDRREPSTPRKQHEISLRERNRMFVSNNFRYALRSLARTPGYTAVFVLTLGLGIGANTAIFSVINGVLLRPLPYPDADRIMYLQQVAVAGGTTNTSLSFVEVADYRTQATSLEEVVEFGDWTFNVLGRGDPHITTAGLVTANYFKVLGLRPHLGRTLTEEDDDRSSQPVAVLTYEYWQRVFGADSSVIGQTLDLTVKKATIVGVLEPGSHYASMRGGLQDFYANYPSNDHYMSAAMQDERAHRMTDVFAKLRPGLTVETARAEVEHIAANLYATYPEAYPERQRYEIVITPWRDLITQQARPMLLILFGTAVFVLVIACANVANLTLTRLIRQERELAIRAALGAGLARIRGQLMAENLVLSLAGATLGLVLAVTGLDLLVSYASRFTNRTGEIGIDLFVLAFTLIIAVGAAMLFAWAPRLPFSQDLGASLNAAGGGRATGGLSRRRAQRALVVSQLAISFVLLVGAGLMTRSLIKLSQVDPGFDLENVMSMDMPDFSLQSQPQQFEFSRALVSRVTQFPQVDAASMASAAPLQRPRVLPTAFGVEGRELPPDPPMPPTLRKFIGPDYFKTVGMTVLAGRTFDSRDHAEAPRVAIINESMAKFYFPDRDPIGRRMAGVRFNGALGPWTTIVGVVADTKEAGLDREPVHTYFLALEQNFAQSTLIVRTLGDPLPVAGRVLEEVRALDPNRPVLNVQTLEQSRAESIAPQRLNATLFTVFAALALVIATVGIAGVLSFSVSQRTNEFGIRMTLGADQSRVLKMVLREGATLAAVALGIGGAGALVLSRFLSGMLFEIQPTDPVTFFGVAALLTFVAIAASLAPARSATSVDPMKALRPE
ncbi:MAG: ABC transporter permease [Gemmatimonadetes bacterium]|nr:ABC transporter permease [Gemmatimonadota bacterium]